MLWPTPYIYAFGKAIQLLQTTPQNPSTFFDQRHPYHEISGNKPGCHFFVNRGSHMYGALLVEGSAGPFGPSFTAEKSSSRNVETCFSPCYKSQLSNPKADHSFVPSCRALFLQFTIVYRRPQKNTLLPTALVGGSWLLGGGSSVL